MFRLNKFDLNDLAGSQFVTSRIWTVGNTGGRTSLPYAFTEQGIYMLMTVLKGPLAVQQSRRLIMLFKEMKDYLIDSQHLLSTNEILKLSHQVDKNKEDIKDINNKLTIVMDNFIDPSKYKEYAILGGEKFLADSLYISIYQEAKHDIHIVDDYIDHKTLELLRSVDKNVTIYIHSDNVNHTLLDIVIDDFKKETHLSLYIIRTNKEFHDRFILIDGKKLYISGASSKDAGNKISTILEVHSESIVNMIKEKINYK